MGVLHLDDALAQPHQVRADPDGTTRHLGTDTRTHGVTGGIRLQQCCCQLCRALHQVICYTLLSPPGDVKTKENWGGVEQGEA